MEGRFPHAVRLIRTNCTDPAQDTSFNEWYDRVHVPDVLSSGMVSRAVRYRKADANDGGPGYLAIHELAWDDLDAVARQVAQTRRRLTDSRGFHPALEIVRAESWKRIGRAFTTPRTGHTPAAGIFVIESRCANPEREGEFNTWYDEMHIPDLLATGVFETAYRFALAPQGAIVGAAVPTEAALAAAHPAGPGQVTYLAVYESAIDPLTAVDEFSCTHRPRLKAAGRLSDTIAITWRGIYRQIE